MANLTNSSKLITKIEAIDSSISSIEDKIGSVPAGTDIMAEIGAVDDKIGTLPAGKTAAQAIADVDSKADGVASDLSDFESEVASTYATKDSVASAFLYKGTVATYDDLPASGNKTWDVYNITAADPTHDVKAGDNVVWNGSDWDVLSGIVDLSNYYTKSQVDDLVNAGWSAVTALAARVTTAEGKITTAEGDIDALEGRMDTAESDIDAVEGRLDTAESNITTLQWDVAARYTKAEINTMSGLSGATAGFVSNTVAEGVDGKLTVTAADNVSIATAESNNKSAIAAIAGAHDNLVDRVEAVEAATGSLPFEVKYIDVTFNNGKVAEVSDSFITANTAVDTWVVTSWVAASYAYEYEVEAGKVTFTASNNESITMRVRLSKEISA